MSLKIPAGTGIYKKFCNRSEKELNGTSKTEKYNNQIKNSVNIFISRLYTAEERIERWN